MATPLPLEEAQQRLLALAEPLPLERVDPPSALGRWLAEPLVAARTQPACDVSAMDGYAVAENDLAGPWQLIGESAAGRPFTGFVAPGLAVRISTGAVLPDGAGAVVVQEDVERAGEQVMLTGTGPARPGSWIRPAGSDFAEGKVLAELGTRLGPAHVALALAAGHRHVAVRRMPRLTIIDSGDELAADPVDCAAHQVPASNGAMLAALAASLPCSVTRRGPIGDDLDALIAALDASSASDVIVTSGGASVGDHDLIIPALQAWGAELDFWKVAIKPGKPLLVARRGRQIVLGLPGNPVSSFVTAWLFLLPLLRQMSGAAEPLPRSQAAVLAVDLAAGGDRREFLRGVLDNGEVTPALGQDSGALAALAGSNCLIDRAANSPVLPAGTPVPVYPLENGGIA
ncbi:MAG: molybdopterin molybdotransferase MoeA [Novosphingobium sp.]